MSLTASIQIMMEDHIFLGCSSQLLQRDGWSCWQHVAALAAALAAFHRHQDPSDHLIIVSSTPSTSDSLTN